MSFENMIAIERGSWSRWGAKNLLISADQADHYDPVIWAKYKRIRYIDVFATVLKEAAAKNRMIGVEYHLEGETQDSYVSYMTIESAINTLFEEKIFVFKFEVLSAELTAEYEMFS